MIDDSARVVMLLSNPASNDPRVQKEARALSCAGYNVTIVAWDRLCDLEPFEEADGYRVVRVRVRSSYGEGLLQVPALLAFCARAAIAVRKLTPSVLHCHDLETLPAGYMMSRLLGCRLIFDAHEPCYFADARRLRKIATWIAGRLERSLARTADAVLVTNDYQVAKYRGMAAKNVRLVANYPERSLVRRDCAGNGSNALTIGRIGALYYDMGIEELFQAYCVLAGEFPGLRLLLVGDSPAGYRDELLREAAGIGGDVCIIGRYRYDELPAYYSRLDICVMPQKRTQWFEHITPTKFFEAMCFGKPVVTSDVGGIGKIVREEECGAVLDEVTSAAICEALRPILKDADLRRTMGRRGIESIESRHNWDFSVRSLLDAYSEVTRAG